MKRCSVLLALSFIPVLSGCGSYRVATFSFVSARDMAAEQLTVTRLKADDTPIRYTYEMPDTRENESRMISFTDMLDKDAMQSAIDAAVSAQGADCVGLKDAEIVYKWMLVPLLGDCYWYRLTGTPVRK